MSAGTDALKQALEALQDAVKAAADEVEVGALADVETEVEELRSALDTARSEIRDALAAVRTEAARVPELCSVDGAIDADALDLALEGLGDAAGSLESAAEDITSALGDEQEQQARWRGRDSCSEKKTESASLSPARGNRS
jgi:hypothetical protein